MSLSYPPSRRPSPVASSGLDVRLLGLVDFDSAIALQERLVYELSGRSDTRGALLLCEHPPLISIGREGSREQIALDERELANSEIPVRWVSRSGEAVIHAPGQLAIYPVIPLERRGLSAREFRSRLEGAMLNVCHELRVPAKRLDETAGLWSRGGQVGHFGVAIKAAISTHGMWLNVCPEESFLKILRNRRIDSDVSTDSRVTSLQSQLLRRIPMSTAREAVIRHFSTAFEFDSVHLHTGHPHLRRTRQRVCTQI